MRPCGHKGHCNSQLRGLNAAHRTSAQYWFTTTSPCPVIWPAWGDHYYTDRFFNVVVSCISRRDLVVSDIIHYKGIYKLRIPITQFAVISIAIIIIVIGNISIVAVIITAIINKQWGLDGLGQLSTALGQTHSYKSFSIRLWVCLCFGWVHCRLLNRRCRCRCYCR